MKKTIVIITVIVSVIFASSDVEAATAVGKAPAGLSNPAQARIMARRAAQVIAMRDNGGKVPQIISENWNPETGEYTIEY